MELLRQEHKQSVLTGLKGLIGLVGCYEFEYDEDRKPVNEICKDVFSILGQRVNDMIKHKENEEALGMLHLILKVFYKYNQVEMCSYLCDEKNVDPWIRCFKIILDMKCPPELRSMTAD